MVPGRAGRPVSLLPLLRRKPPQQCSSVAAFSTRPLAQEPDFIKGKYRTAGLISDSHLPEPSFRTIRTTRGVRALCHRQC